MSTFTSLLHSVSQLHRMDKLSSVLLVSYPWTFQFFHSLIHSFILAVTSLAVMIILMYMPFSPNLVYICWVNLLGTRHKCVPMQTHVYN